MHFHRSGDEWFKHGTDKVCLITGNMNKASIGYWG